MPTIKNTLLDNSEDFRMVDYLNTLITDEDCKEICIATGYWDLKGTKLVYESLMNFFERGGKLRLLIGEEPLIRTSQFHDNHPVLEKFPDFYIQHDINQLTEEYLPVAQMLVDRTTFDDSLDSTNSQIQIRVYGQTGENKKFLHAKCYIFKGDVGSDFAVGIVGSSNFTQRGLEDNAELNYMESDAIRVDFQTEISARKSHVAWFEKMWNDESCEDWTGKFIQDILLKAPIAKDIQPKLEPAEEPAEEVSPAPLTPYEAYIHLLNDKFGAVSDTNMLGVLEKFLPEKYDKLQYQMDAVALCNQIMHIHGGFLLGDVVGLGKTVVGVLLIKYYLSIAESEGRSRKVLIVTPPAIKSSWEKTIADFDNNQDDKITSYVDFITTGSIDKVMEGATDDEETTGEFDGELKKENYSLILIDESHNFRNNATQMYEKLDNLIEDIFISSGYYPYMGLLSATLQNNRPEDLRNQIYLFQRKPSESTIPVLGGNLSHFFSDICDRYSAIIKQHPTGVDEIKANRSALIQLSSEVQNRVLSEVLVRRTRTDIKNDYHEKLHFPEIVGPCALEYKMNDRLAQLFYDTMRTIAPDEPTILKGEGIVYMRYRATEYLKPEFLPRYTGKNMTPQ